MVRLNSPQWPLQRAGGLLTGSIDDNRDDGDNDGDGSDDDADDVDNVVMMV